MANGLDLKRVVKHLADGSFGENLCRVCLEPLTEFYENIFTKICKEGKEYCIADVLNLLCGIQIEESDHYNVCPDCFVAASNAYRFYLNTKANDELLHYYVDELARHIQSIEVPEHVTAESLCVSLPAVVIDHFDFDIKDITCIQTIQEPRKEKESHNKTTLNDLYKEKKEIKMTKKVEFSNTVHKKVKKVKHQKEDDNDIVIVLDKKGLPKFFSLIDGILVKKEYDERCKQALEAIPNQEQPGKKERKKREPLISKRCSYCPIAYRFIAKLKEHMRIEHDVILYSCKLCDAYMEDLEEFEFHKKTHTNTYECDICKVTFRKRDTIINHVKEHKEIADGMVFTSDYVCMSCGLIAVDEDSLRAHTDLKHYSKHACFYCGRTYKGVFSLEKHVKKHEMYMKQAAKLKQLNKESLTNEEVQQLIALRSESYNTTVSTLTCEQCGRGFRGERALLWHTRLHNNERPFVCDICGRGFVTLNRRNQHAVCAHSPPTRRCPLCPALFHLRSMVNTHIKKVHLKPDKLRSRPARQAAVLWHTAPVPVQELSVALQADILTLQAEKEMAAADAMYNEER